VGRCGRGGCGGGSAVAGIKTFHVAPCVCRRARPSLYSHPCVSLAAGAARRLVVPASPPVAQPRRVFRLSTGMLLVHEFHLSQPWRSLAIEVRGRPPGRGSAHPVPKRHADLLSGGSIQVIQGTS